MVYKNILKKEEQKPEGRPEKDERKARLLGLKNLDEISRNHDNTHMYFKNKFEQRGLTL